MGLVAIKNTIPGDWGLDIFLNACYCSIKSFVFDMCVLIERPLFFRGQTRRSSCFPLALKCISEKPKMVLAPKEMHNETVTLQLPLS